VRLIPAAEARSDRRLSRLLIRKETVMRRPRAYLIASLALALVSTAAASAPSQLRVLGIRSAHNDFQPRDMKPPALRPGVTYTANLFPIPLRLTPPDAAWSGGQGTSVEFKTQNPSVGWVELVPTPSAKPRGAIAIVAPYRSKASVAATVAHLRTGGTGAEYEPSSPVEVAGFSGTQFDGNVTGQGHAFIPFSPRLHVAAFYSDRYFLDGGEVFHFDVLDVHGKTVVVLLESAALPADQFPAFLTASGRILDSLKFPG
jgi:hypothetical protein